MKKVLLKELDVAFIISRLFEGPKQTEVGPNNEHIIIGKVVNSLTLMMYNEENNYISIVMLTTPDNYFDWEAKVNYACKYNNAHFKTFEDERFFDKENKEKAGFVYTYYRL